MTLRRVVERHGLETFGAVDQMDDRGETAVRKTFRSPPSLDATLTAAGTIAAAMILFVLTGQAPPFLLLTLLVMCYLAGYELWKEEGLPFLWKAWWVLFVFITNVVGFGVFWVWLLIRRRRTRTA